MPTATDLVTDLPADFEVFGQAVATSMADLLGGTSGQVLAKNSNTDMDFVWVTSDDANAIQNTIVDAKGDLISATGSDTPARLAVGANGETLVADSSQTTGLVWAGNFAAGKNKIINGDMRISQRGTSFTIASPTTYTLDRYFYDIASAVPTGTVSQQTFTPGTAPVAGYEAVSFLRVNSTANNGCSAFQLIQRIEDVRTFAGQTVTFSFWAKADASSTFAAPALQQVFGSGGSGTVTTAITMSSTTLGTGWTRYTGSVAVPSISGKTIGTSSYLQVVVSLPTAAGVFRNGTYDYWGWQLEAGSVATAFQTATGTIQGELAACQRYFFLTSSADGAFTQYGTGQAYSTSAAKFSVNFPTAMRIAPTSVTGTGNIGALNSTNTAITGGTITVDSNSNYRASLIITGSGSLVAGNATAIMSNGSTSTSLAFSAEL
jgi:hypothetical protein